MLISRLLQLRPPDDSKIEVEVEAEAEVVVDENAYCCYGDVYEVVAAVERGVREGDGGDDDGDAGVEVAVRFLWWRLEEMVSWLGGRSIVL